MPERLMSILHLPLSFCTATQASYGGNRRCSKLTQLMRAHAVLHSRHRILAQGQYTSVVWVNSLGLLPTNADPYRDLPPTKDHSRSRARSPVCPPHPGLNISKDTLYTHYSVR
ncbi:hypothetical protein QBC41DRAFT_146089 [Cercophora samala]|uniref:Secreted protein n=1 Tax=Cercophora samala TaxID=330535 RepID=A0AA39Z9J6_9PEZI|nr:hypothetical protein QBC41DRAFT_146089 [Cercophora samala]